ncbi:UDP-N-acetylmuramoyl-L-alanyl-D-glutamate--2,6-diaminopimelate ligase [Thalassotalea atypica]|uniref:UDP-N-acetylmuramoyl-L-alanyl-D-glutamate--2, 6-diaminopimelate ligase n=1 Tax=Thalassotalea atypica TaxID=2054316 RepID=UPI0025726FED|nr:UDP-N-acetylmuramoyl-L-alanyl-D-glutamate--2,6-diaminopimelate ligase [Thalassotalea atypica]
MPNLPIYSIASALAQFNIHIAEIASNGLVNDSREVTTDSVFCAISGSLEDGRQYIDSALEQGAVLVIGQCHSVQQHGNIIERVIDGNKIDVIQFFELDKHLISLAQHYYGYPHRSMNMIGVTGTNGKTSTTQILANCFDALSYPSAVIGTTGAGRIGALTPIKNTTPGPTELSALLAKFKQQDIKHVVMEVSSHALDQHRVSPEMMDIAVFTNLSRDHLDYHGSMEAYASAKFKLFIKNPAQYAVVNGDDEYAKAWLNDNNTLEKLTVFGRDESISSYRTYVRAADIVHGQTGLQFTLETEQGSFQVKSKLIGDFNAENLLAAIAVLRASGITLNDIVDVLPNITPCDGRMETFDGETLATCIVDYAHTPDALENALKACRQHCQGELWLVFGCGGDRDQGKRALMGDIAEQFADHLVVTNDNPRNEAPELIVNDILSGCKQPEKITVMLDRAQAVKATLANANEKDMVLLAGKGHEDTIQIGNEIIEYSERKLVKSIYKQGASA